MFFFSNGDIEWMRKMLKMWRFGKLYNVCIYGVFDWCGWKIFVGDVYKFKVMIGICKLYM